ncbi:MAG: CotH kinase family protein [Bacteroidales bacterium]|nr:CotH kinase family protein [Bacteroidales bacterium]
MRRILVILSLIIAPLLSLAQTFTDSNLPIVIIDTDGGVTIPDEPKVLATMKIIWHQDGSRNYLTDANNPEFLNYNGRIGIERRGSSSQDLPKKPYGLETLQADNVTNNNVSILGMPRENDWVLNSLAFDQTGMRDVLSYELSEKLGQYASRRVYCEVVINGDYKGLYVFMEKIKADEGRVNIEKMDETCNSYPEVSGGYITKADKTTGNDPVAWQMEEYGGWWWPNYAAFIHHYPKPDDVTDAQHNYIKNVFFDLADKAGSHNTSIENGIPSVIDIPSFVDFMIMGEVSSNVDVYELSTFFHKDRKGKLRAGPIWDYNLAYGHDEFGSRSRYDVWQFDNDDNVGPKFWKDLFDTDEFRCYLAKRWFEVTAVGNPLNYNTICARMDEIDELISEGVARDNQRWNRMGQHTSEVQAMKTWLQNRYNWLNSHIGSYNNCDDIDLPPLVISKIHYHPADLDTINGNKLEFIQINNNGDEDVDLTGFYLRELGITYNFPAGSRLAARDSLVLCSDSTTYVQVYNKTPFGEYDRKLSNKSEIIVIADAWGNVIDEVCYSDSRPWPTQADGYGPYLQLIDLDLDNSLPQNWTFSTYYDNVDEIYANYVVVYPNPSDGIINIISEKEIVSVDVIDLSGRIIATYTSNTIDISFLNSGLYILKINGIEDFCIEKISIIH